MLQHQHSLVGVDKIEQDCSPKHWATNGTWPRNPKTCRSHRSRAGKDPQTLSQMFRITVCIGKHQYWLHWDQSQTSTEWLPI